MPKLLTWCGRWDFPDMGSTQLEYAKRERFHKEQCWALHDVPTASLFDLGQPLDDTVQLLPLVLCQYCRCANALEQHLCSRGVGHRQIRGARIGKALVGVSNQPQATEHVAIVSAASFTVW